MVTELIHIGFGNYVSANQLVGVASPSSAPIKRLLHDGRGTGVPIALQTGRGTRAGVGLGVGAVPGSVGAGCGSGGCVSVGQRRSRAE